MIEYTVKVNKIGDTFWYINGELHRENGPAIELADGYKWYINGELHREDGPAVEYADGRKGWYINGEQLTEDEHKIKTKPVKDYTVSEISEILGYNVRIVE